MTASARSATSTSTSPTADGEPYTIRQAICLHEEDSGLLWKHFDAALGTTETRRSRRLVISFIITADNYEYAIYWYFYQDGTIEFEVKLTGIVLTSALPPGEASDFGTVVAPQTLAAHHQHFLSVRLDMAVDGLRNTVYEVDTEAVPPGPANPLGNAFRPVKRPLRRESEAQRVIDPLRGRYWLVANPGNRTALGHEPAYKLVPGGNVLAFSHPDSPVTQRAAFATKHLWVTPYRPMSGSRRAITRTSTLAAPDSRPGRKPIARSRTPTSCFGTPWAVTTSPGPKTGRSCRPSGPDSCSNRPGSSTTTRRSTWHRAHPRTAKAEHQEEPAPGAVSRAVRCGMERMHTR